MRQTFFGPKGTTLPVRRVLERSVPRYQPLDADIRDQRTIENLFCDHSGAISAVVHAAAQPSHDWAARAPKVDFTVNANGTLILLEMTRRYCPDAAFVFLSTNKVYGDTPNRLPFIEHETRWELDPAHRFFEHGVDEAMTIDDCMHSLFGVSKVAADLLVQEYGRYFGLKTACFRCGCLTGPDHAGVELHGFLSYLMKCAGSGHPYTVFGYKGKQVRDNIHSRDLVEAIWQFILRPRTAQIYNMGGSRFSNCSMLEAIAACERITNRPMNWSYKDDNRVGDHIWWISDVRRFRAHYPEWHLKYDFETILSELHETVSAETNTLRR